MHRFEPHTRGSPVAAVAELKKLNLSRVFNDYDFGGYLIANGVAPFIDGRTELYGEKFFVDHNAAMRPDGAGKSVPAAGAIQHRGDLMRTQSAATKLLDHIDGWQKVYADDIATIHVRKPGAVHARGTGGGSEGEVRSEIFLMSALAVQKTYCAPRIAF